MAGTAADARDLGLRESRPSGVPLLVMEIDDSIRKPVKRTLKETKEGLR